MPTMNVSHHGLNLMLLMSLLLLTVRTTQAAKQNYKSYPKYVPCRPFVGFSRCVDPPLRPRAAKLWCPYHVCGLSFIVAKKCGKRDRKATHYCKARSERRAMFECVTGKKHKWVRNPVGCRRAHGECTGRTRVCACQKLVARRVVYTKYRRAIFKCFARRYGKK